MGASRAKITVAQEEFLHDSTTTSRLFDVFGSGGALDGGLQ
jgi:hypothetical protein